MNVKGMEGKGSEQFALFFVSSSMVCEGLSIVESIRCIVSRCAFLWDVQCQWSEDSNSNGKSGIRDGSWVQTLFFSSSILLLLSGTTG